MTAVFGNEGARILAEVCHDLSDAQIMTIHHEGGLRTGLRS